MALTERSRAALYRGLSDVIDDEEAVGEMLSYFPARDVEEPATCALVEVTAAGLRTEIAGVRTEIADLRADVSTEIAGVRTEIADLRSDLRAELRTSLQWTIGAMVSLAGVLVAALALLR